MLKRLLYLLARTLFIITNTFTLITCIVNVQGCLCLDLISLLLQMQSVSPCCLFYWFCTEATRLMMLANNVPPLPSISTSVETLKGCETSFLVNKFVYKTAAIATVCQPAHLKIVAKSANLWFQLWFQHFNQRVWLKCCPKIQAQVNMW